MRPRRPRVDLPSSLPRTSSGSTMRSRVVPRANWPGGRMKASPGSTTTSSVRSGWSAMGSMKAWVELRKILKLAPKRTSTEAGCTSRSSKGSMTMRPSASFRLMSRSDKTMAGSFRADKVFFRLGAPHRAAPLPLAKAFCHGAA